MNKEKIIIDLMKACGDDCRTKILDGRHDDVSVVMNYLEVLTTSNSWAQAAEVVKKLWHEYNQINNMYNPEDEQRIMKVCPVCLDADPQDEDDKDICEECGGAGAVEETDEDIANRKWDAEEAQWEGNNDK